MSEADKVMLSHYKLLILLDLGKQRSDLIRGVINVAQGLNIRWK